MYEDDEKDPGWEEEKQLQERRNVWIGLACVLPAVIFVIVCLVRYYLWWTSPEIAIRRAFEGIQTTIISVEHRASEGGIVDLYKVKLDIPVPIQMQMMLPKAEATAKVDYNPRWRRIINIDQPTMVNLPSQ